MPLTLDTAKGQITRDTSDSSNKQTPFGLCKSEAIFDNNLFGLIPIEQVNPVALNTACCNKQANCAES